MSQRLPVAVSRLARIYHSRTGRRLPWPPAPPPLLRCPPFHSAFRWAPYFSEMPVALVESEKTAVICSGLMHQYLWLATGGKSCINDRLLVLQGRKIIAFPDIDGFKEWTEKLAKYPQLGITVSPILQQNATAEDLEAHIDIADWLIRYKLRPPGEPVKKHCVEFLKAARYISPEYHEELEALIEDFDLEFWGVERIEEESPQTE